MKNILILYNPYYQENVIEQHLEILKDKGAVAFGKVKSKLRDYEHPYENELESVYSSTSKELPLQLFLTDYNSIYVANVISIKTDKTKFIKAPKYYDELEVEEWFVFDDLRLIVHNDFKTIRDKILPNFKATNFNNHTYAVYGNKYVYPMQLTMKEEINYFQKDDEDFKYYTDIFKSKEQITIRQNLIDYNFGEKRFYSLSANTQDNIISAEVEYMQNKQNPLYDFSTVVVKYSKALELELYIFMKLFFKYLMELEPSIQNVTYNVQSKEYILKDILEHKPNYGTYKYLIKSYDIKNAINDHIYNNKLKFFIFQDIIYYINTMQSIRNESVHGGTTSKVECDKIRKIITGIGTSGALCELSKHKKFID